jgi:hypothetical protein
MSASGARLNDGAEALNDLAHRVQRVGGRFWNEAYFLQKQILQAANDAGPVRP